MTIEDFTVGDEFYMSSHKWRCTDVGSRVVVAIKLDKDNENWYTGPPYVVAEHVLDEYDIEGATRRKEGSTALETGT